MQNIVIANIAMFINRPQLFFFLPELNLWFSLSKADIVAFLHLGSFSLDKLS